jgi:serine/threonine-protein kinase HipA
VIGKTKAEMSRLPKSSRLRVRLNDQEVGRLQKDSGGGLSFVYDEAWLMRPDAVPVSLSLPFQLEPFRGAAVQRVFENLLPDSDLLLRKVAERVGAEGTDAFSLLAQIGRDCVGALQFVPEGEEPKVEYSLDGERLDETGVESILKSLARAPLGVDAETEFRISIAGAQEKTALLRINDTWVRPRGPTPTTHIFKTQIGHLQNGMDLSNSVENEYFCLKLLAAFGLAVAEAEIAKFGQTTVLVVSRFDRNWTADGKLIRLAQEDDCQALSVAPTRKYQTQGGPGMVDILNLLKGSDEPRKDHLTFVKAQILFWLLGATDGHAKNFSIFLGPKGRFKATPIYDVLSAQPSLDQRQIEPKQMKLAMFVGDNRHYGVEEIEGRHFVQTVKRAHLSEEIAHEALEEIKESAEKAIGIVEKELPQNFPMDVADSIFKGLRERLRRI